MAGGPQPAARAGSYPDPATFARVAARFEAMRPLSPSDRAAQLALLTDADRHVAAEVQRLLRCHDDEHGALATPELALPASLLAAALDEQTVPTTVGPYRLLRLLGQGGMGSVYLAERADGEFIRTVAVKLLRADLADPELLRRFRTERRILAQLRHPNIAALLDGGTTDQGRPYVVMEYVEGRDLVTHAEEEGSSLPARLELFRKVCSAVDHAHRSLVVHRDLKPANILVDSDGEPKLLDFGIAKLLASDDDDESRALTSPGMLLLTPEYASPEQVRGDPITTATDVYALGTVLYELLTGRRAQPLETRLPSELERVVCEREPVPPSTLVGRSDVPLPRLGVSRARLQRRLRGDLDTIVLCALQKEPARRYASALELGDDLQRFLRGLPVHARRDTWTYRWHMFVRRHRWPVAAVATFVLLLAIAAVVTGVAAQRAARERDVARRESAIATEITSFLVGLYEMAEPDPTRANQLRARDLLDRGSHRIRHELQSGPLVRAGLMEAMGRSYLALGLHEPAAPLLTEARRLRDDADADPSARAGSLFSLGVLATVRGEYELADDLLRQALAIREGLPDRVPVVGNLVALAELLRDAGRHEEAAALAARAQALAFAVHGERHVDVAATLVLRASIERDRGEFEEALRLLQQALDQQIALFGPDHPAEARTLRELGVVHKELGHYEPARAALEQALAFDRATSGADHPDVDTDLFALAMLEVDLGDLGRAETMLREVLARDRAHLGDHPYVGLDLGQLAAALSKRGEFAPAEELYREALAMQQRLLPPDDPEIATTLSNLGVLLQRTDRIEAAAPYFTQALEMRLRVFPSDHPAVLTSRNLVAVVHHARGEFAAAEVEQREILAARRKKLGDHPQTAGSLYALAMTLHGQARDSEALPLVEESVGMYRALLPVGHADLMRPVLLLGIVHLDQNRADLAEPLLREAVVGRRERLEPDHLDTFFAECQLGRCLRALRRFDEGEALLRATLARGERAFGAEHAANERTREVLADLYLAWGKPEQAAAVKNGR